MLRLKELKKQSQEGYIIGNERGHGVPIRSYQKTFETILKYLDILTKRAFSEHRYSVIFSKVLDYSALQRGARGDLP